MTASHSALVHRAHHIDPAVLGQRIRSARAEARMTQTDVAKQALSTAYLSRIEAGERRPTLELLKHIAEATGVSIEALLFGEVTDDQSELRLRLVQAEHRLISDEPREALALAQQVGEDADAIKLTDVVERAELVRAIALLRMAEHERAIPLLEALVSSGRASAASVRAQAALCRCYVDTGRPRDAVAVAEDAQQLIVEHGLERLPEALDVSIEHARAYVLLSDPERAAEVWRRAREAALFERLDDIRAAYLAASDRESDEGAYDQAWRHAERASALAELQAFQDKLQRAFPDTAFKDRDKRPAEWLAPGASSG
ncbi:MAG: helix-turn-helix domain-containing protein [Marmoricola sp.]